MGFGHDITINDHSVLRSSSKISIDNAEQRTEELVQVLDVKEDVTSVNNMELTVVFPHFNSSMNYEMIMSGETDHIYDTSTGNAYFRYLTMTTYIWWSIIVLLCTFIL